jgi:hypothetical protein
VSTRSRFAGLLAHPSDPLLRGVSPVDLVERLAAAGPVRPRAGAARCMPANHVPLAAAPVEAGAVGGAPGRGTWFGALPQHGDSRGHHRVEVTRSTRRASRQSHRLRAGPRGGTLPKPHAYGECECRGPTHRTKEAWHSGRGYPSRLQLRMDRIRDNLGTLRRERDAAPVGPADSAPVPPEHLEGFAWGPVRACSHRARLDEGCRGRAPRWPHRPHRGHATAGPKGPPPR